MSVAVLNAPADVDLELAPDCSLTDDTGTAYAVVLFVTTTAELHDRVAEAARDDRLAWVVYPKARQRGTGLNRDVLWEEMTAYAVRPVRQVSVDDTWSALRFRPAAQRPRPRAAQPARSSRRCLRSCATSSAA